jgi:hypothetical protein
MNIYEYGVRLRRNRSCLFVCVSIRVCVLGSLRLELRELWVHYICFALVHLQR